MTTKKKKVTCYDVKGNPREVDVSELKFRPAVYGILIEDGKILLSKERGDGYDFPGGGIEIDESIEEALKREFWEETGLKVEMRDIVACESSFFDTSSKKTLNSVMIYYLVDKVGGELSTDNFDEGEKGRIDMAEWIDLKDTSEIRFYNSIDSLKIIEKAKKIYAEEND